MQMNNQSAKPRQSCPKPRCPPALLDELRGRLGERLSTATAVREQHGHGESYHTGVAPEAVAFVHSTEEAAWIVQACVRHHCPMIPFGAGTSLEGHVNALHGGISMDMMAMNQVLEVNVEDLDCRVQAGVTRKQLNQCLRDTGLFFPIDPGADASIGGMAATRASGTNAVRYGTMRENVLGLTVVMADGKVIRSGGRARKSAAGYDLTRLLVGSEGTLGVITEIQLRLYGIPESISAAVCAFDTLKGAVDAVILTIQCGIPVARIELLDEVQMNAVNRYSKLDYAEQPTLFFEFHGSRAGVREQVDSVSEIVAEFGGGELRWAIAVEDRNRLWQARHNAYYAALALRPGCKGWATDVCVPISKLAECIIAAQNDVKASQLTAPIVGHVGDGNFHLSLIIDPNDPDELSRASGVNERLIAKALALGGTCSGEHGVGCGKIEHLPHEHGEAAVAVMRQVKQALDPMNLMNPGKML